MSGCPLCGKPICAKGLCRVHYVMQWQRENPERTGDNKRRSAEKNRAKRLAKARTPEGRVKKRLADAASYLRNRERRREKGNEYARAHAAESSKRVRAWKRANPDATKADVHNRRARLRGAQGKHTGAEVKALFEKQRGCCAVCREKLTRFHKDHIQPLIAGGTNYIGNIQLLCAACNISKNAKDPIAFMQSRGFLL